MPKIHALCCQKGGVGKTTLAVNVAAIVNDVLGSTDHESPVLVVDADPQRSGDWWAHRLGESVPFAYAQADDLTAVAKLSSITDYAHIFVDTPGSLEDERILHKVLEQADDAIVPMTPETLSYVPVDTTVTKLVQPMHVPYRVVINLWDPRDGTVDLEETREFINRKGWASANTVIRRYKVHSRAAAEGLVCTQYAKNRVAMEAREDITRLALELGYGGR